MKDLDVYVIGGQSNALGMAKNVVYEPQIEKEIFLYQEGGVEENDPERCGKILPVSFGMGYTAEHFGPEIGMAEIFSKQNRSIALIKCAWAGTGLYDFWNPGNNERPVGYGYMHFIEAIKNGLAAYREAGYIPILKGIAWMQGESDADKTKERAYMYFENLTNFFNCLKKDLNLPDVRIVVGEIYPKSPLLPLKDIVIEAQREFAATYPNAKMFYTGDLPVDRLDAYHWYGAQEIFLGQRFAEGLLKE